MKLKNIVIVGAGIAGKLLEEDIKNNAPKIKVIGFVDDKTAFDSNMNLLGKIKDLSKINNLYKIDEIVVAIPSANGSLMRKIILSDLGSRIPIRLVPRSQRVIGENNVRYSEVKNFEIEDFLGRPFLKRNVEKLKKIYKNKVVFVTGGAGSIGSEIVKQLIDLNVKKVIVYDNSEYLVFNLDQDLKENKVSQKKYELIIGNILNKQKVNQILKKEKPDFVFHAAAYKHVYLMEENIDEAVVNNVIGTKNIVDCAIENKIKNFVFISTDKVVNPTSIMGSTKKLAEYYIKSLEDKETNFNIVRFGNVINSNGSVLPLFEHQIEKQKCITVTHKEIRRFFMSIREAAQLVITSVIDYKKDQIYILDMGELINIYEAALCLIRTKNLIPNEDVKINFIGLKKGEKMIEELFTKKEKENLIKTELDNIFKLKNYDQCPTDINQIINNFEKLIKLNADQKILRNYFIEVFPTLKITK